MNALRAVLPDRIPVARPLITKNGLVVWPWTLSRTERRADKDACLRTKRIDERLLEAVLDERNGRTNARRIDRRN